MRLPMVNVSGAAVYPFSICEGPKRGCDVCTVSLRRRVLGPVTMPPHLQKSGRDASGANTARDPYTKYPPEERSENGSGRRDSLVR